MNKARYKEGIKYIVSIGTFLITYILIYQFLGRIWATITTILIAIIHLRMSYKHHKQESLLKTIFIVLSVGLILISHSSEAIDSLTNKIFQNIQIDVITINFQDISTNTDIITYPHKILDFPEITKNYASGAFFIQGCKSNDFRGIRIIYLIKVSKKCKGGVDLSRDFSNLYIDNPFSMYYCNGCNSTHIIGHNEGRNNLEFSICGEKTPEKYTLGKGIDLLSQTIPGKDNSFCTNKIELKGKESNQIFKTFPKKEDYLNIYCKERNCNMCEIDILPHLTLVGSTNLKEEVLQAPDGTTKILLPKITKELKSYSIDSDYKITNLTVLKTDPIFCMWTKQFIVEAELV